MDASLLAARVQGPSIVQTHEAREMHSSVGHVPFNAGPVNAGLWSPDVAHPKQSSTSDAPPTPDCFDHPMLDPRGHSEVEVKALSRKCRGVNPVAARSPALFGFLWRQVRMPNPVPYLSSNHALRSDAPTLQRCNLRSGGGGGGGEGVAACRGV